MPVPLAGGEPTNFLPRDIPLRCSPRKACVSRSRPADLPSSPPNGGELTEQHALLGHENMLAQSGSAVGDASTASQLPRTEGRKDGGRKEGRADRSIRPLTQGPPRQSATERRECKSRVALLLRFRANQSSPYSSLSCLVCVCITDEGNEYAGDKKGGGTNPNRVYTDVRAPL